MFGFLAPYKLAAGLVVLAALLAGTAYTSFNLGSSLKQGEWDAQVVARKSGEDAALKAAAEAIAKIEVKSEQIIQPLRTEIRTNTVYRDCLHSPDSVRNLNFLITGTGPELAASGGMPSTKRPR